jgi:predicted metalloprotease with PDZ domain
MYWLEQPPFNIGELASFVQGYFEYSSAFWQDDGTQPYKVFIRRNANVGTGGTALLRSFTFGWHDQNGTSVKEAESLLSHEIIHNWPGMVGTGPDESRYAEGMAEYYSLRLLLRAGLIDASRFLDDMNSKVTAYYLNPFVNASDSAAQNLAWQEPAAQRIAYGRGLIYLTNIDAQVRGRYNGSKSLDDLALDMLAVCRRSGADCTPKGWLSVLSKYLGATAVDEYKTVASGHPLIRPQDGSLGPCYDVIKSSTSPVVWTWKLKEGADPESDICKI